MHGRFHETSGPPLVFFLVFLMLYATRMMDEKFLFLSMRFGLVPFTVCRGVGYIAIHEKIF